MPFKKRKNSINRMTDREILSAVRNQVESSGAKITNMQGIFFLELVEYAIQKGGTHRRRAAYISYGR